MSYRPPYTNKDKNHAVVRDFMKVFCGGFEDRKDGKSYSYTANFRGCKFIAYDTSNFGGVFADYLLECVDTSRFTWVEVKTPDTIKLDGEFRAGVFQDGEIWLRENSSSWCVVVTDDDVKSLFEAMIEEERI